MRWSWLLLFLLVGAVLYIFFGMPSEEDARKSPIVSAAEMEAVEGRLPMGPEKRKAFLETAVWQAVPRTEEGRKIRIVRLQGKIGANDYDRLYKFQNAEITTRAVNTFGDQWKDHLKEVKWEKSVPKADADGKGPGHLGPVK